jgi:hypothetical protein
MDVITQLYLDTLKDIKKLAIDTKERLKQDWEALPYHEESKEKESCNIGKKTSKVNKQQFGVKKNSIIHDGKLEGMLDDQFLNMKMEVKLGQLIKSCPQLRMILTIFFLRMQNKQVLDVVHTM